MAYDLTHWHSRHWRKGSRTYAALLHQTLFGDWELEQRWGGRRGGGGRALPASSHAEALALIDATAQRRTQRGYLETTTA